MLQHRLPIEATPARAGAWYRQPVLWVGAAILVASLAGCVWMIVLGAHHADLPLEDAQPHTLLGMPMHQSAKGPGTGILKASQDAAVREAAGTSGHGP